MSKGKTIHDSVHGGIPVEEPFLSLLHRPEMQRLHNIKQLGLSYLVFPGANHTRFEHSLGVFHLAMGMGRAIEADEKELKELGAAAMLHDICHPPFSHTLEEVMQVSTGKDHMELAASLISGDGSPYPSGSPFKAETNLAEELESSGVDPVMVASIVAEPPKEVNPSQGSLLSDEGQSFFGAPRYLNQIIHGPVDADQMDYLLRDAHYTGVAHGIIDRDRILSTITVHNGSLVVGKGGAAAIEGMMVARSLMYSSIYFHKTVRIAEMMMAKAVECASESTRNGLHLKTEADVVNDLLSQEGAPSEMMCRLLRRDLYKKAYSISGEDVEDGHLEQLLKLTDYSRRKEVEQDLADRAGLPSSRVIIDVSSRNSLLSMSRIGKTDVPILEDGRIRPMSRRSPLAKALQNRSIHDWALMVSCPAEDRDKVLRAAKAIL